MLSNNEARNLQQNWFKAGVRLQLAACALLFFFLGSSIVLGVESPHSSLRVMSFNIRFGTAADGPNHWEKRKALVVEAIERFKPDLLGTQETLAFQAKHLQSKLGEFSYFGRSRQADPDDGEQCGIFYRTERFVWLAGGHFWLSETPEEPASKSWDSSLPRMASWGLLADRQGSGPVLFLNTHFDHRGKDARRRGARLIRQRLDRIQNIASNCHVIVTGDFNAPEGSPPYDALLLDNESLVDTYRAVHAKEGGEGTFNGWRGQTGGGRIDWVLVSPTLRILAADIDRFSLDDRYPSDHFPVTAVVEPNKD